MMVSTQVRHLLPGDRLYTGGYILHRPYSQVRTPKGQKVVEYCHRTGVVKKVLWNASTNITVWRG